jgi:hypothetical protein
MKTRRPIHLLSYAFVQICTAAFAAATVLGAQTQGTLSIPPDSPRWELDGQAKPVDYQGRKSLFLDGGAAVLKDFEMRDGVVDVDVATPASAASEFNFGSQTRTPTRNGFIFANTGLVILMLCSTRRF